MIPVCPLHIRKGIQELRKDFPPVHGDVDVIIEDVAEYHKCNYCATKAEFKLDVITF